MKQYVEVKHEFKPVFDKNSKILILGTFPSVKSRVNNFYYGNPQNRFWKVISEMLKCDMPNTIEEKKSMLLNNGVAIWDVVDTCKIVGSSDTTIKDVVPVNIKEVLENTKIKSIYANGNKAKQLYDKYLLNISGIEAITLPSTSPANAKYKLEDLIKEWKEKIIL